MGGPGCFDHVGDAFSYGDYGTTVANNVKLYYFLKKTIHS